MPSDTSSLTLLGSNSTEYPTTYSPAVLERIAYEKPVKGHVTVTLECPEFTSLCPKTAQPDFANVTIMYGPGKWLVESKSLKLYLFSFRNHGEFHEECIKTIAKDLHALLDPEWVEVHGDFYPRGGIKICPVVRIADTYS